MLDEVAIHGVVAGVDGDAVGAWGDLLLAGLGVGNELGGVELEAGDIWLPKTIGDRPLLDAVRATLGEQLASGD